MPININEYPHGSPERVVALYLRAWQRRDWDTMLRYVPPKWKERFEQSPAVARATGKLTPFGHIRQTHEWRDIDDATIGDVREMDGPTATLIRERNIDPALVRDVAVAVVWHQRRDDGKRVVEHLDILIRCVRAVDVDTEWRVIPNSYQAITPTETIEAIDEVNAE